MQELSRTKIKQRVRNKTNPTVNAVVREALKHKAWHTIAQLIASSTRKHVSLNVWQIDKLVSQGDIIVVPGKILAKGKLTKKIKICALGISAMAKEKLHESKSEFVPLLDEIKRNPKAEGVKILP